MDLFVFFFANASNMLARGIIGPHRPHERNERRQCYAEDYSTSRISTAKKLESNKILLLRHLAAVHAFDQLFRHVIELVRIDIIRVNRIVTFFLAGHI